MSKEKKHPKYTTIHIPVALANLIDNLIDNGEFAYSSRSEFVKDAIRRSLEKHGFYPNKSWNKKSITSETFLQDLAEKIKKMNK